MPTNRLPFEIDVELEQGVLTAHAGVPMLVELFQVTGAAAVLDERLAYKQRKRGLTAAQTAAGLFALWAAGGDRAEDMDHLRQDSGLPLLLGHDLPAAQTVRDFLSIFHEDDLPLLQAGPKASVPSESANLAGLAAANRRVVADLQARRRQTVATLDIDATILRCSKRAALRTYDGTRGYQPVLVLWAEQDLIVADEFRDGNVPAGSGNKRVVEAALAALPAGIDRVLLRGDSALYEHDLLAMLDDRAIGYCISADMSPQLAACIRALPEDHWKLDRDEGDAVREWTEVAYLPDDGIFNKDAVSPRRYLAIRIRKKQGTLFTGGHDVRHFCIVTTRSDPQGGTGRDLIRWHRGKAGTIEHTDDVLTNELAAEALPSQKFGANAAWLRLNTVLYNLLTAFKRIGLPEDLQTARPKRLRFLAFNVVGKVLRHARETLLRVTKDIARHVLDRFRAALHAPPPTLAGV